MTLDEAKKSVEELKAQGADDDQLLGVWYAMFVNDEINLEELEALCGIIGYSLSDDFKALSPEEQKTKGYEEVEDSTDDMVDGKKVSEEGSEEKPSKETIDAAKEIDADDAAAKKLYGMEDKGSKEKKSEDDEDEEREEAKKLFDM